MSRRGTLRPTAPDDAAAPRAGAPTREADGGGLRARLEEQAAALGFHRLGVAEAGPLDRDAAALRRWLEQGFHGEMGWMADTVDVRADPTHPGMLPGATRVVALVTPYARDAPDEPAGFSEPGDGEDAIVGRVARYARGRDYHNVVGKRLRKLVATIRDAGHRARGGVDALPILERAWAQRAGVGFIGKNACLIVPGLGSHVFLSAIVTDAPLPTDEPMRERCGDCRLCLDACPTDAFTAPRSLDARRCISYLTIEHPGPIDPALRAGVGDWVFGCDVCQDVCPYNRTRPAPAAATEPFAAAPERLDRTVSGLLEAPASRDDDAWDWTRGSPLRRAGPERLARNAAIVLGNRGGRRHLPVLDHAARQHPSPTVRDAAGWAGRRLRGPSEQGS